MRFSVMPSVDEHKRRMMYPALVFLCDIRLTRIFDATSPSLKALTIC